MNVIGVLRTLINIFVVVASVVVGGSVDFDIH